MRLLGAMKGNGSSSGELRASQGAEEGLPVAGGTELRVAVHAGGYRGKGETRGNSEASNLKAGVQLCC